MGGDESRQVTVGDLKMMLIFGIMLEFYIFRYILRSRRDDSSGRERMENLRSS